MALIKCPNCGKEISDTIDTCIHCNHKLKDPTNYVKNNNISKKNKITPIIVLIIVLIILIPFFNITYLILFKGKSNYNSSSKSTDSELNTTNEKIELGHLNDDEVEYVYEVKNANTLPSNLKPNSYIDLYISGYADDYVFSGNFINNIRIIDVRDKNNNIIDTSTNNESPTIIKLAVTDNIYDLLQKTTRLSEKYSLELSLKNTRTLENEEIKLVNQDFFDFVNSHSIITN